MKRLVLTCLLCIAFTQLNAQDWGNLNRYREANDSLMKHNKTKDKVVFMGNSITQGWYDMMPEFFHENNFVGRGIGGQTTPQMLVRFRPDVIDLKPKAVVILAGTNDIAGNTGPMTLEETFGYIVSMAELADQNNIKVVISSVLPAYDYPWKPGLTPAPKIVKLNNMLKDYCKKQGFAYLDYFSAMVDDRDGLKDELTYDGVHPNKAGYEVMAPLALATIKKL